MAKIPAVTIRDVARRAGVSIATVSYVLNESGPVSEATRQRVLEVAAELGYRPSVIAQGLRAQESRNIGYSCHDVLPELWHPILDRFLHSMTVAAETYGYHILMFTSRRDDKPWLAYEELILTGRVDGFILSGTNLNDGRIRYLLDKGFPFVAFGRANEEWDFPYVDVDGEIGGRQVVEHLLSLGHRRIGLIAWPETSLTGHYRYLGYIAALREAGVSPDPAWIVRVEHAEASGARAMRTLLSLPYDCRPTAVLALSDLMAIGAMQAIYEAGLQPGKDIAIVGFDDMPTVRYLHPPLTSVHQFIEEVGERVIDMLVRLIRGEELEEQKVLLPPKLVVRASSGGIWHR